MISRDSVNLTVHRNLKTGNLHGNSSCMFQILERMIRFIQCFCLLIVVWQFLIVEISLNITWKELNIHRLPRFTDIFLNIWRQFVQLLKHDALQSRKNHTMRPIENPDVIKTRLFNSIAIALSLKYLVFIFHMKNFLL